MEHTKNDRRCDLDALRAIAMVLGIVLHASLAYFPFPWPAQDPQQQRGLAIVFAAIHGFRMPLFFLLSGFFTAMVAQRRGLKYLLRQRVLRIGLPLLIGVVTILPLDDRVISWVIHRQAQATAEQSPLIAAITKGDVAAVERAAEAWQRESFSGQPLRTSPLVLAAMGGNPAVVRAVLASGVSVDDASSDGNTPLHAASFMGEAAVVRLLLDCGADPNRRSSAGKRPLDALGTSADVAVIVRRFLGMPPRSLDEIVEGREAVRALLVARTPPERLPPLEDVAATYQTFLSSPRFTLRVGGTSLHLFASEVFDHLWFLWYLCWLVGIFAVANLVGVSLGGYGRWWLVGLSCLPQAVMAAPYGPDTALGLLPAPHLLLYYGCFYGFGASTFAHDGQNTRLGQHWKVVLPVACCVFFPAGLAAIHNRSLATVLQPAFAWSATLGVIGVFRHFLSAPSPRLRWLADASYWMYLIHLPLVILFQSLLAGFAWPAGVKLLVVLVSTVAILLVTYRWCVRYTLIGRMLNGPRRLPLCPSGP